MILLDILSREKLRRFFLILRQEGFGKAVKTGWRYVSARLKGHGLTSIHRGGGAQSNFPIELWLDLAEHNAFHVSEPPAVIHKRRKVAMIGDLNLPQCRKYRVEQLDELWRLKDVDYAYAHYEDKARAISLMQDATHVMFYRLASLPATSTLAYEARRLRLPILYDLDDPLFSVSAYGTYQNMKALPAWRKAHFVAEAPRYLDVMNGADMISVSTPGMVAHTQLYTNRSVHLRRNFADRTTLEAGLQALTLAQGRGDDGTFRVGFASGSQGHEVDFAEIQEDIIAFLDGAANRQLVILGHFDKDLLPEALQSRVQTHPFSSYDNYLEVLASVDVAVMPLADDLFNRCKSGVRVIDAASVGVPSVVGTVSDMASLVQDGKTGRVLSAGDSWCAALEEMATDPEGTRAMGVYARKDLEKTWAARAEMPVVDPELMKWVCS